MTTNLLILALATEVVWIGIVINNKLKEIMASQADLDAAIAALPKAIEDALAPVIAAIVAKSAGTPVDLSAEINQLNAIPAAVAAAVAPPTP